MTNVLEYECEVCHKKMSSLYANQFNQMVQQHETKHKNNEVKQNDGNKTKGSTEGRG